MTAPPASTPMLAADRFGRLAIRCLQVIIVLALAAIVVFLLVQIRLVVIPVLIAVILAAAIGPLVNWMRRRGVPAILATWLAFLALLLVSAGIVTLITLAVRDQWQTLVDSASAGLVALEQLVTDGPVPIDSEQLTAARTAIIDFVTSAQFGTGALAGVTAVAEFVTGTLLTVVILFFFLKDGDRIWNFLLGPFSGQRLARGRRIGATTIRVLGGYVRGTAIVALVDAVAIGVGLAILQVLLALPLAVIVFLAAFIPLVGATLAGVLAALVALVSNGPIVALIVVAIVVLVNQLEGDLLQPVVMAQNLKLHPLVILIALAAGTVVGGITGAVLAVPLTAVGWAIITIWDAPAEPPSPRGGQPVSERSRSAPSRRAEQP